MNGGRRIAIDRLDDSRLDVYRNLARSNLTNLSGRFVAEGQTLVERLLSSRYPAESILVAQRRLERLPWTVPEDLPVYVLPDPRLHELVGFHFHRGVLACGRRMPPPLLEEIVASPGRRILGVCPQVVDPTNLGGIIRNLSGFGADGLVLGPGSADPFSRRVVRVSMGTVFALPVWTVDPLVPLLQRLQQHHGFQLVAAVLDEAAQPLERAARPERVALLWGGEGHGLERRYVELCDRQVTIPMQRGTDSLNLAVASAVFLYHFTRVAGQP